MTLSARAKQHVLGLDDPLVMPTHEHQIFLLVGEGEARELMAGRVPESVKEQARVAVEWEFDLLKLIRRRGGPDPR